MVRGTRCSQCNFSPASTERKSDRNFFSIGFKPKAIFRQYGIPDQWGKPQLFYFLFHQELNGEYPTPPFIIDIFQNKILKDNLDWVLHHINNHNWDDNIYNLLLCLRHEHTFFEQADKEFQKQIALLYESL